MNLTCYFIQKRLAGLAAKSERVDSDRSVVEHVQQCEACRLLMDDYRTLNSELDDVLPTARASDQFADEAWSRYMLAKPHRRRTFTAIYAAAAACAVFAFAFAAMHSNRVADSSVAVLPPTTTVAKVGPQPERVAKIDAPSVKPVKKADMPKKTVKRLTTPTPKRTVHRRHWISPKRQMVAQGGGQPAGAKASTTTSVKQTASAAATVDWSQWGAYYETYGDYQSASAAYAAALKQKPTAEIEFNAGRSAECAGDVSQAVEYYSQLLRQQPADQDKPKKGTLLWNEHHGSV